MKQTRPLVDWLAYHSKLRRGERIAELWVRDIVAHLRAKPRFGSVLDFGCGYFDVGLALADRADRIDGLEIDAHSLKVTRTRSCRLPATRIVEANDDVPREAYDLILVNSVFQYFEGDEAILGALKRFRTWLKPGGEVLIVDLIPRGYAPVLDGLRSLFVAARQGILPEMVRFLWSAVRNRSAAAWHRIDPNRMRELADESGFAFECLPFNLSPSRRRFSCTLRAA